MKKNYEKLGMGISIAGGILLSFSAVVVSILAKSQAILLDGVFTLITLVMAFISFKVINLVNLPENKKRPFGFVALEPFLNITKSLIILIVLIVCLVVNIEAVMTGGRTIELDLATYYTVACIVIYLVTIFFIKKCKRKTDSSILALEVKEWYIDTILTVGIAISLGVSILLMKLGYTQILPYIDPSIVILLVIVSLPMPLLTFIIELKGLLLISADNIHLQRKIKKYLRPIIQKYGLVTVDVYALRLGRMYEIFIYTNLKDDNTCIKHLDTIRLEIINELSRHYDKHNTDVIFSEIV